MTEVESGSLKDICASGWDKYKWWVIGGIILILVLLVIYFASVRPVESVSNNSSVSQEQLILPSYSNPISRVPPTGRSLNERPIIPPYDVEYVDRRETRHTNQYSDRDRQDRHDTESRVDQYRYRGRISESTKPSFEPSKTRRTKGEEICARAVEEIFGVPFPTVRPNWLKNPKTGRNMEIDCYNDDLKIGVEYHGRQHYERVKRFHKTEEEFESQIYRDNLKLDLCDANGVYLITVPYTVPFGQIKDYIIQYLPHNRQKRLDQGLTE